MNLFKFIIQRVTRSKNASQAPTAKPEANLQPSLRHTIHEFEDCSDLTHRRYQDIRIDLVYFGHLVDQDKLHRDTIQPMLQARSEDIQTLLEQSQYHLTTDSKDLIKGILSGKAAVFHENESYLVDVAGPPSRSVGQSETETVIVGPHDAFNEDAGVNLALLRKRIKSSHLKVVKLSVGEVTKTDVYLLYIKGLNHEPYVQEAVERIRKLETDSIFDTHMLIEYIDDSSTSIFPQFLTSERPDAAASKLVSGRIVGIVDGSPTVFSAPTSFFEFFSSSDDYYQRWILGTATRLLRYLAFAVTISFTALYVAVTTYHYEMIPESLLLTLAESRSRVPFPPVYEALVMEVMIELLREAGARLPTKIGQTIGIVGGIVIGQAAVQAGLTSNILIIAVASSAISSFVIPSYVMSASIRLIRFVLLILAGWWGLFGMFVGMSGIVIHLSGLTSLGSSYLTPLAPLKPRDWLDVFVRAPLTAIRQRPSQNKSPNPIKSKNRK
ncbi:spore germination protein [Cohnella panacarvi]|uniref:spore germination protein n=1 Tax=Cohnella panacarvi TaxID=400776 RepID=UPI000478A15F|nr:spore germination protein [Cohnella panacarvi]